MPLSTSVLSAIAKIAEQQHGVVDRGQALSAGLSPDGIKRLVSGGVWSRLHTSVYSLWTPSGDAYRVQRLFAATLWLGDGSTVSHRAAAALWRLDGIEDPPLELIATVRTRPVPDVIVHFVRTLPSSDVVGRQGLRVTSAPRTLIDLAAVARPRVVELALESALRRQLTTRSTLLTRLENTGIRQSGRGLLRRVLQAGLDVPTESALETRVWQIIRDSGLPTPVRQFEVLTERGILVARLDFAYPHVKLGIEADGYEFHSRSADWQRDRERQNELAKMGWTMYRVTKRDATRRPRVIVADVGALLQQLDESVQQKAR